MASPFLAEIRIVSFNFPPKGWALCNGQLMPINQNQALFSILGTTYGGDGRINFALPNLQGRIPIHFGAGIVQGDSGGEATHVLTISEMPTHAHAPVGSSDTADQGRPANNLWANSNQDAYGPGADVAMNPGLILSTGGSQPHENMPPYLTLNFVIALQGIFPSRN
jgi:microcystin-dependent protein